MSAIRRGRAVFGFVIVSVLGSAGLALTQGVPARSPVVQKDIEDAMKGEAFAYAKYMLFAQQARERGNPELADLFERAAKMERMEHFREHAELAGLLKGSDADNLRNAMAGERYEKTTMYPQMAERARQAGDRQAAERFTEIGRDEGKHYAGFEAALKKLESRSRPGSPSNP